MSHEADAADPDVSGASWILAFARMTLVSYLSSLAGAG
jgi:hypothetical protein